MAFSERLFESKLERTRDLVQSPDWYMKYGRIQKAHALGLGAIQAAKSGSITEAKHEAKQQQLALFEQLLAEGAVRIGDPATDELEPWDEARTTVDRIMIHHSNRAEGISLSQLNTMHLLRLYLPRYQRGDLKMSSGTYQPIYSAHFDEDGNQVFYGYHWKVEQDGSSQRLLPDEALLWHAGDWEMNRRSVAIVIDDNLTDKDPTPESLEAVVAILSEHYGAIDFSPETLLGHHATFNTLCPGNTFESGWKQAILARLG
jgi:hypothetical protein